MLLKLVRNATYILLYNTLFTGTEHTLPRLPPLHEALDNDPDQDIGLATATRTLWDLIQRHQALVSSATRVSADPMLRALVSVDDPQQRSTTPDGRWETV